MAQKTVTIKTRIVNKHDTAAHWDLAKAFYPMKGELIIYDPDPNNPDPRIKIGDGERLPKDLPFVDKEITNDEIDAIWDELSRTSYRIIKASSSSEFTTSEGSYMPGDGVELSATEWNDSGYTITIETIDGDLVDFEYLGEHNGAWFAMPASDVYVTFTKR